MLFVFIVVHNILLFAQWPDSTKANFILPPKLLAVTGIPIDVYFYDVTLNQDVSKFTIAVECSKGTSDSLHWNFTPSIEDTGNFQFTMKAYNKSNVLVETSTSILSILPDKFSSADTINLLIIGNSLTEFGDYSIILRNLLRMRNVNQTTNGTKITKDSTFTEGWGGKTWYFFLSERDSPFLFGGSGSDHFSYAQYINTYCKAIPNIITIELGYNDCFSVNPDSLSAIDDRITEVFSDAKEMIRKIKSAAPGVKIGIFLTPTANSRDTAFEYLYGERMTRWSWKKIQLRLVQRYMSDFGGESALGIYTIHIHSAIDPVDGFPELNPFHPIATGDTSIANTIFSWINYVKDLRVNYNLVDVAPTNKKNERFELSQNFPNPFNPSTDISYALPVSGKISLKVYDILGKEIATLVDGIVLAGNHTVTFTGDGYSGVYICVLRTESTTLTRKMLFLK